MDKRNQPDHTSHSSAIYIFAYAQEHDSDCMVFDLFADSGDPFLSC